MKVRCGDAEFLWRIGTLFRRILIRLQSQANRVDAHG